MNSNNEFDFEIAQGNTSKRLRQWITLQEGANLTGATGKLRFKPEGGGAVVERSATITTHRPSITECEAFEITVDEWQPGDLAVAGRFAFQWKITLLDDSPLNLPERAPALHNPDRYWQIMEVTPVI